MKPIVNDEALRDAVVKELEADPEVAAKYISVTAIDGAITLAGHVMTYHEKHVAVRAAERVAAVIALADDIEVRPPALHERADDEIAEEIAHLRRRNVQSPDSVGVQVHDGRVILHGEVESASERDAVESAARRLTGVRAVDNLIKVKAQTELAAADVEHLVQEAIARVTNLDAGPIWVTTSDSTVHLHGRVPSLPALQAALKAAETVPGVTAVESDLVVTIQEGSSR
jgi:osmotically-inducible protein OsmY